VASWVTSSWTFALNKYLGGKASILSGSRSLSSQGPSKCDKEPLSAPGFYTKRSSTVELSRPSEILIAKSYRYCCRRLNSSCDLRWGRNQVNEA
jgi:hypothetical protein